jgi:hypothetical protein
MHANRRRGEVVATLDGSERRLRLTLGALAELETAFAAQDLNALVERFATGRLAAGDMAKVIGAGLRGAGADIPDHAVLAMHHEDGAAGFAALVGELLAVTFGAPPREPASANP